MGTQGGAIGNTINQSGLSTGYTSGVTDLTAYLSSTPVHDSLNSSNYFSGVGSSGSVDFNLGASYSIQSFILWTDGSNVPSEVRNFSLLAAGDAAFTNPVNLGSFTATGPGITSAVGAEVFSFSPTQAQFIRMQITSNNGGSATVLGEAAFARANQSQIPEPSTFILGGFGLALALIAKQRQSRKA
jgi:hypothetical protein